MGLIGLGRIGRATADLAQAFGMRVIGHERLIRPVDDLEWTDLESLLRTSDVVSLHCPLTGHNNPLLGAKNCLITPHIAWATRAARKRLMDTVLANIRAFQQGRVENVVNC